MFTKIKNSLILSIGIPVVIIVILIVIIFFSFHHTPLKNKPGQKINLKINQIPTKRSSLTLAELTSLKNYAFDFIDNGQNFTGSVYSPTNWSLQEPFLEEHIGNYVYTNLGTTWFRQSAKSNSYLSSPYISTAKDFLSLYNGINNQIVKGSSCQFANINGTTYIFKSPSADKKYLTILASACLANQGHYLLAYFISDQTNFNNLIPKDISYGLKITSINQTKPLVAPQHYQVD